MTTPLLRVQNLTKRFAIKPSWGEREEVKAVNEVSFEIEEGITWGLVGESGCGKTTLARCLVSLEQPTSGQIWFRGEEIGQLSPKRFRPYRDRIQIVFQDPLDSLNPRLTVCQTLLEPLNMHTQLSKMEKRERLEDTIEIIGLHPDHLNRFPHQLSTGQQQRVGIARATICKPDFVVLDEPTSALDLSVRGKVLELLLDLQQQFNITYLFISHDLGIVRFICERSAVMYLGYMVEISHTKTLFKTPLHPYSKALVSAIPQIDPHQRKQRILLKGEVPSPTNLPRGCSFSSRCPVAERICFEQRPELLPSADGRLVACHLVARER